MTGRHVVVIGGGLAGLTAALGLADAGADVTLLEARPRLGGAATSFSRGGLAIDNGQHVFLRCCTSYQQLLGRLGVTGQVAMQDRFDVTVLSPRGQARLRRSALPAPLHLGRALASYRLLPLADRLRIGRAALAMRGVNPADPAADAQSLGDWLAAKGQRDQARRLMWDLFTVAALNIAGDDASLALAATVIKTGLLGAKDAADIGIARVPLGDLHDRAAAATLTGSGATVRLGAKATAVRSLAGGRFAVQAGDEELEADGVVVAVPPGQAGRLAGPAGVAAAGRWDGLGAAPIVNVHVRYDRPVTALPFAAAVESPVQWVFDKTRSAGVTEGQYLAISLSAADGYVETPAAALREQFLPELARLFPAAAGASVTDFFVTRERRATFRQAPGTSALRPGTVTSVPGLLLAGAWTDTGWPDTMEGAVRSGQQAAEQMTGWLAGQPAASQPGPRAVAVAPTGTAS
jgi:squalene-associated FAD-dependent desaturase